VTRTRHAPRSPTKLKVRHAREIAGTEERSKMRILVSQETGKSPFDPSVIREAHRRVARKLEADVTQAIEDHPLPVVIGSLSKIQGQGRFGDRKVFVAALWDLVGDRIGMSLSEFKDWLFRQHHASRLTLARADLVSAMPYDLVRRSEIEVRRDPNARHVEAQYHFVVDPAPRS
jgi:hypothetical protein